MDLYATVDRMSALAAEKVDMARRSWMSYLVMSMLAGAYVGIGIVLIFVVGAPLAETRSVFLKPMMGASFGIALTLVVVAGSELFTGNNLVCSTGILSGRISAGDLLRVWGLSWIGNLLGSVLLAFMAVHAGSLNDSLPFIERVSAAKMAAPATELFLRAALCNWLVCLAIWTAARLAGETAKCILIFWCLYAFIACGFEHSVANMTLLTMSLLAPHGDAVTWAGMARNLAVVTAGNIAGGGLLVGGCYWFVARDRMGAERRV